MSLVKKRLKRPAGPRRVPPIMTPYSERRSREHLTPDEMSAVIRAAGSEGLYAHRNETLIRMMYRHALRVSEAVGLKWEQLNLEAKIFHVARLKGSVATDQPLYDAEIEALKTLREMEKSEAAKTWVFLSSQGKPIGTAAVRKIVARAGEKAGLPFPIHPHMFRHSCGYYLASRVPDVRLIQDYLGHVNIQNTTRYTMLAPGRFRNLWTE